MKNVNNNVFFTQESIDALMASFMENVDDINRLARPLVNMDVSLDRDHEA